MSQGGRVQMVRGPASVQVKGYCKVLGMNVSDMTIDVRAGKVLPFELGEACTLVSTGGETWLAYASRTGTSIWKDAAAKTLAKGRVVMLVGGTDAGKSTFSAYLANMVLEQGLVPCIVDGDIGQGDLAPPAAIGAAVMTTQAVDLREVNAHLFEFVGTVTPVGVEKLVATKLSFIAKKGKDIADVVIVNTDGYVDDGGISYKRMLARELKPDVVVCIGRNRKLARALLHGPWLFLRARSAGHVKTRADRAGRRMEQFLRFVGGDVVTKNADSMRFVYKGRPVAIDRFFAVMEGMFVGLGSKGEVGGFGVIKSMNGKTLTVMTNTGAFDTVYLSDIGLKGSVENRLT